MPLLPPDASPEAVAEEARAQAYRLQARNRAAARTIRERRLLGNPAARRLLMQHWAPILDPIRDIGDPSHEQQGSAING
jgi:hypothetical protein